MPFGYFGAKHGLARYYPPPKYEIVVEPFAGAAGYSCYWARQGKVGHAILVDSDPAVVALWHRLQRMTVDELMQIPLPGAGTMTSDPLIAYGGRQMLAVLHGRSCTVTTRMHKGWAHARRRIAATLPYIRGWDIGCGDFSTAPDIDATWFIDPPYRKQIGTTGEMTAGGYWYGKAAVDDANYDSIAEWCCDRQGQTIVCEQAPADWLPFSPFRRQPNAVGQGTRATRSEVVWVNG